MKISLILVLFLLIQLLQADILTLNEAKEIALNNNPGLLAQEQSTKSSKASY